MEFAPFFRRHDDIARYETRAVTLLENNEWELPAGEYGFVDSYCNDNDCDCRKVMIAVVGGNGSRIEATIGYGWESAAFYTTWFDGDEKLAKAMAGSHLEIGAQQSSNAQTWLTFWNNLMLKDEEYLARIRRHYRLFKKPILEQVRRHK